MDPVAVLASTSLFRQASTDDLATLAAAIKVRTYQKGSFIFHEGDPGNVLLVLVRGQVKLGRIGRRGDEVVFAMLGPGDTFGELALFEENAVRASDAQATVASECLVMSRATFHDFIDAHPKVLRRVIEVLTRYIRATDEAYTEMAFLDIPGRVAKKLLELAGSHGQQTPDGVRIGVRLTQRTLAGMVAASRENVNRALARFQALGVIRQDRGYITILRPQQLRTRA